MRSVDVRVHPFRPAAGELPLSPAGYGVRKTCTASASERAVWCPVSVFLSLTMWRVTRSTRMAPSSTHMFSTRIRT